MDDELVTVEKVQITGATNEILEGDKGIAKPDKHPHNNDPFRYDKHEDKALVINYEEKQVTLDIFDLHVQYKSVDFVIVSKLKYLKKNLIKVFKYLFNKQCNRSKQYENMS